MDRIKTEQQELKGVAAAYAELDQKHTELSSQANVQAQLICELEVRTSTHTHTLICKTSGVIFFLFAEDSKAFLFFQKSV